MFVESCTFLKRTGPTMPIITSLAITREAIIMGPCTRNASKIDQMWRKWVFFIPWNKNSLKLKNVVYTIVLWKKLNDILIKMLFVCCSFIMLKARFFGHFLGKQVSSFEPIKKIVASTLYAVSYFVNNTLPHIDPFQTLSFN